MKIYTDGAISNNGQKNATGGWAFLALDDFDNEIHREKGKVESATNNICELTAVLKGCEYSLGSRAGSEKVVVFSDSAYIVNCYKDKWYKKWKENGWLTSKKTPVLNRTLWEQLIPYFDDPLFDFKKVKGHSTNQFNNIVDQMAVEAKNG